MFPRDELRTVARKEKQSCVEWVEVGQGEVPGN